MDFRLNQRWYRLLGLLSILVVSALLIFPRTRSVLNANEGAIAGALSFLLVLLYLGQYRLQSRQVSLSNKPHLEIQKYEFDRKEIEVWLSNLGRGVATDLEIVTKLRFPEDSSIEPVDHGFWVRRVGKQGDKKKRVGNSLKAGEHYVRFVGEPHMALREDGDIQGYGLLAGTRRLVENDIKEIEIEFFVSGSDLLDNEYGESIYREPFHVELDEEGMVAEDMKLNTKRRWPEE